MTFNIMTIIIIGCRYAECRDYLNVILSIVVLSGIMLSVGVQPDVWLNKYQLLYLYIIKNC